MCDSDPFEISAEEDVFEVNLEKYHSSNYRDFRKKSESFLLIFLLESASLFLEVLSQFSREYQR